MNRRQAYGTVREHSSLQFENNKKGARTRKRGQCDGNKRTEEGRGEGATRQRDGGRECGVRRRRERERERGGREGRWHSKCGRHCCSGSVVSDCAHNLTHEFYKGKEGMGREGGVQGKSITSPPHECGVTACAPTCPRGGTPRAGRWNGSGSEEEGGGGGGPVHSNPSHPSHPLPGAHPSGGGATY